MPFHYVASTKEGGVVRGTSTLGTREAVIQELERKGLTPVSVENVRSWEFLARFGSSIVGRVSYLDTVLFTKHLAVMIKAGLTLIESIRILVEQTTSWQMRRILQDTVRRIEAGEKFSDALARYPKVFSHFYVNIIDAGEVSGTLETNLEHLAEQYTKDYELRRKIKTAMLYPSIVLIAALLIGFFFTTYVLPQIANLFTSLQGVELPLVTRVMLAVSDFTRENTFLSFFSLIFLIWFVWWFVRLQFFAPFTHAVILRMPVFGNIVKDVNLARFSLVMSTLLRSGIPITQALDVTSRVLGNMYFRKAIQKSLEEVQRGIPISDTLSDYPKIFPKLTTRMINVGEQAGKLEEVLEYLTEFYELEVETTMRNLSTILEPLLLLMIGAIALAMAFGILIPIYNFISAIGRI